MLRIAYSAVQYPIVRVEHMLMRTGKVYQVDIIGGVDMVKVPLSISYLTKEDWKDKLDVDLTATIVDEGFIEPAKESKYGRESFIITVKLDNGFKKKVRLNNTSKALLCNAYGEDSEGWVDRPIVIHGGEEMVGKNLRWVMYVVPY